MSSDPRQATGHTGEHLACVELERRGYTIVARRFRTRLGEIDIVARDGGTLVFVEVKARHTLEFGTPLEAVTRSKRKRLCAMAAEYLSREAPHCRACRFDVVGILLDPAAPKIDVVRGAFDMRGHAQ